MILGRLVKSDPGTVDIEVVCRKGGGLLWHTLCGCSCPALEPATQSQENGRCIELPREHRFSTHPSISPIPPPIFPARLFPCFVTFEVKRTGILCPLQSKYLKPSTLTLSTPALPCPWFEKCPGLCSNETYHTTKSFCGLKTTRFSTSVMHVRHL